MIRSGRWGFVLGDVDVGDDGALCGLDPLAVFGDLGEDAQRTEDGGGAGRSLVDVAEDAFGDAAKIASTAGEEPGGGSVTENGGAGGELVFKSDGVFGAPTDEVVVDMLTFGMVADGAFAGVASEIDTCPSRSALPSCVSAGRIFGSSGGRAFDGALTVEVGF